MASDGQIVIRIGAAADRSIDTVFGGVEKRALRARDNITRALGGASGTGNPLAKSFDGVARSSQKAADSVDRTWTQELARLNKIAREQDRLFERGEREKVKAAEKAARERVRIEERAARAIEREHRATVRRQERDAADAERTRRQFAERTSWRATKFLVPPPMGALGAGRRIASDVLRGAGIDFSLQGSVQRAVSLQQGAVQLANSAYIPGMAGLAGQRANPADIERFIRSTAQQYGMTSGDTLEGLRSFVGRTGDLATGQAALPGLLKLGAATGTDPNDLLTFAGTIGATAFDSPAKDAAEASKRSEFINKIVNMAAQSGKLGTTEISDLAKYGPKLAATAQAFGGDATKNLGEMFALAQLGLKGGAASPAQATTSVAALVNTLRTPARRKAFAAAFKSAGIKDGLESQPGVFRSASDIITDSIVAAGTDTEKFKSMWANVQGARSVEGLRQIYLKAGGGQAGKDAIRQQFAQLGGTMSEKEINTSAAASLGTIGAKAKSFQERWDEVIAKMSEKLIDPMERLADPAIKLAGIFADAVKFAADMPLTFGGLVVAAAVLRAGIESWARAALEKRIMALPTGTPGIPGAGSGGAGGAGLFAGGGGYGGARGVWNSPAAGLAAGIAASVAIDMARDQNASLTKETGGKGILDVGWEWLTTNKGLKEIADENLDAKARQDAVREGRIAGPGAGDQDGKNAPALSAEDYQRSMETALSRGVRITNLNEIRLTPSPPSVDPNGRQPGFP